MPAASARGKLDTRLEAGIGFTQVSHYPGVSSSQGAGLAAPRKGGQWKRASGEEGRKAVGLADGGEP